MQRLIKGRIQKVGFTLGHLEYTNLSSFVPHSASQEGSSILDAGTDFKNAYKQSGQWVVLIKQNLS